MPAGHSTRTPAKPAPAPTEPGAVAQLHVADALAEHRAAFDARRELRTTREPLAAFIAWCHGTAGLAAGVAAELDASETELSRCRDAVHVSRQEKARVIGQRAAADQALAAASRGKEDGEPVDHALDLREDGSIERRRRAAAGLGEPAVAVPGPAEQDLAEGIERLEAALAAAERHAHAVHEQATADLRLAEKRVAQAWIVAEEIDREARSRITAIEDAPRLQPGPVLAVADLAASLTPRLEAIDAELAALDAILDRTTSTALDAAGRLVHERRAAGFQDPIRGFL